MLGTVHYAPGKIYLALAAVIFIIFIAITGGKHMAGPRTLLNAAGRYIIAEETLLRTSSYHSITTPHFLIRYQGDKTNADMVARAAEQARQQVDAYFKHSLEQRVPVVVYADTESLAGSMGWDRSQQAMGVYWAGTIKVLDPSAWVKSEQPYQEFYINGPMVHEYAHLQIDYLTGGNYPRWFTEGMAQYVEKQINGFQFTVPDLNQQPYTLDKLNKSFNKLEEERAYWQSLTAVEYIIEKYGEDAPFVIMDMLKQGYSMSEALDKVTGSYDQLAAELYQVWQ